MVNWKLEGSRLSWTIIGSRKKHSECVQLNDVTEKWNLDGIRSI